MQLFWNIWQPLQFCYICHLTSFAIKDDFCKSNLPRSNYCYGSAIYLEQMRAVHHWQIYIYIFSWKLVRKGRKKGTAFSATAWQIKKYIKGRSPHYRASQNSWLLFSPHCQCKKRSTTFIKWMHLSKLAPLSILSLSDSASLCWGKNIEMFSLQTPFHMDGVESGGNLTFHWVALNLSFNLHTCLCF